MKHSTTPFFREAALRICSSLDIDKALDNCLNYIKEFIPGESMHLSVYLPDVKMLKFVAMAGKKRSGINAEAISVQAIDWEAPENKRRGMPYLHVVNNPKDEPEIEEVLHQLNMNPDFSVMVMHLHLDGSSIGEVALKTEGTNRYTDDHGRLFVLLREPIALANALKHQDT